MAVAVTSVQITPVSHYMVLVPYLVLGIYCTQKKVQWNISIMDTMGPLKLSFVWSFP